MKGDQMGNLAAYPIQRELPLSNWMGFRIYEAVRIGVFGRLGPIAGEREDAYPRNRKQLHRLHPKSEYFPVTKLKGNRTAIIWEGRKCTLIWEQHPSGHQEPKGHRPLACGWNPGQCNVRRLHRVRPANSPSN